jgi:hypothetical protein
MKTLEDYYAYSNEYEHFSDIFEHNMAICKTILDQNIVLWFWNHLNGRYRKAWEKSADALNEMQRLNRKYRDS